MKEVLLESRLFHRNSENLLEKAAGFEGWEVQRALIVPIGAHGKTCNIQRGMVVGSVSGTEGIRGIHMVLKVERVQ